MEKIIQIKVELDCDVFNAFKIFTVNKLLEKWLTEKADVETKIGGKYELFWEPENRENNSTIGCKITGIEKNKFISFDWKGPVQFKSFMNFSDPLTHVIVFFSHKDSSDTEKSVIHLFHTGWKKGLEWQYARNYFENAWIKALEVLREKIENTIIP